MKIPLFLLTVLLVARTFTNAFAGEYPLRRSYECFDLKGNKRWAAVTEIKNLPDKGRDIYLLTEKGEGYYSGFKGKISWVGIMEFENSKDRIRPFKMEKRIFDREARPVSLIRQKFDFATKKASYIYEDLLTGEKKETLFDFNGDIINRLTLSLYVQKFLENGERQKEVYLLTVEPKLYKMDIRIVKKEMIDTSCNEKTAYKLCLDPNIGLLNIFKVLMPKAYIWHLAEPDFKWLRYHGPESNPSSIKVEINTLD